MKASERVRLETVPPENLELMTRFKCYADLERVAACLLPHHARGVRTRDRHRASRVEALAVLCVRLAGPERWATWSGFCGWSSTWARAVLTTVAKILHTQWEGRLTLLEHEIRASRRHFAARIWAKGAPYDRCIGFVDGTLRPIAEPVRGQRAHYSGHHHDHGLSYQSVVTPDGLIRDFAGPFDGRRHDGHVYQHSHLEERLEQCCTTAADDVNYHIFGDSAYPRGRFLQKMIPAPSAGPETLHNEAMAKIRVSVEHGFAKVVQLWQLTQSWIRQKVLETDVGIQFRAAVLLTNVHTCMYGSLTGSRFQCDPPTLEEYLHTDNMLVLDPEHYSF